MNHKDTINNLINLRDVLKEIMGKDDGVKPYLSSISEAVHLMASETISFDTQYYKVELVEHNKGTVSYTHLTLPTTPYV